jgi:hypothetical protein
VTFGEANLRPEPKAGLTKSLLKFFEHLFMDSERLIRTREKARLVQAVRRVRHLCNRLEAKHDLIAMPVENSEAADGNFRKFDVYLANLTAPISLSPGTSPDPAALRIGSVGRIDTTVNLPL